MGEEPNVPEPMESNQVIESSATASASSSQDSGFSDEDVDSIYKIGDIIDARCEESGAWFEAKIVKVFKKADSIEDKSKEEKREDKSGDCNENVIKTETDIDDSVCPWDKFIAKDDGCTYSVL